MDARERATRLRQLLAEAGHDRPEGLTADDTLGRVARAAKPWAMLLVRLWMWTGLGWMAYGFWTFFRYSHGWQHVRWTLGQDPYHFFIWPFLVAAAFAPGLTIMVALVRELARRIRRGLVKRPSNAL